MLVLLRGWCRVAVRNFTKFRRKFISQYISQVSLSIYTTVDLSSTNRRIYHHKAICVSVDLLHKSYNAPIPYPTMQHFVTEMCTPVHISVTKCCVVRYLSNASWDVWDWPIGLMCDLPQLSADDWSVQVVPIVVTHAAPFVVVEDLYTSLSRAGPTSQTNWRD